MIQYKKLLVVGEGDSGKSTFIKRLRTGEIEVRYIATMGVKVHPIPYSNELTFKLWDCGGKPCFGGLREGYYIGGVCALIFFDLSLNRTNGELIQMVRVHVHRVRNVCDNIPIVIVGSKLDLVIEGELPNLDELGLPFVFISTFENTNFHLPLQCLHDLL